MTNLRDDGLITRVLVVLGTRPEAIKLAPVIKRLKKSNQIDTLVCVTAQHREMLDQVLNLFGIAPDIDLNLMRPNQSLSGLTSVILEQLSQILDRVSPDLVVVHGDTTTAFATSLAAFYKRIEVAHVEAGLRTGDMHSPWPEELNRRFIGQIASLHFAPTAQAKSNLLIEAVPEERIWVTGNTVIDALLETSAVAEKKLAAGIDILPREIAQISQRVVLVTGHRRENFGEGLEAVCRAVRRLAETTDAVFIYPVHPNPQVMKPVHENLDGVVNVRLVQPMEYLSFVALMNKSHFIITDSGGIQEEAPSLGKPVLVMRDNTERPEAVTAGTVRMVGTNEERIFGEASRLLTDPNYYGRMSAAHNPYGDGLASERIVAIIEGKRDVRELTN